MEIYYLSNFSLSISKMMLLGITSQKMDPLNPHSHRFIVARGWHEIFNHIRLRYRLWGRKLKGFYEEACSTSWIKKESCTRQKEFRSKVTLPMLKRVTGNRSFPSCMKYLRETKLKHNEIAVINSWGTNDLIKCTNVALMPAPRTAPLALWHRNPNGVPCNINRVGKSIFHRHTNKRKAQTYLQTRNTTERISRWNRFTYDKYWFWRYVLTRKITRKLLRANE